MKEVLYGIRAKIGAENCCEFCTRDRCRVSLKDIPRERIVVDADKAFEAHGCSGKRCDFILFTPGSGGKLFVVPIELKSGGFDVSSALEQLQEGATFAEEFARCATNAVCRPVLIHGRGMHRMDLSRLNLKKIWFRGVGLTVKTQRCDRPRNLAYALAI